MTENKTENTYPYRECPIENVLSIRSLFTFSLRRFAGGYSFKGETHDFAEAVCVTDGKVGVTADKNVYILSAGQMIIHPPGEFHAIWSDCDSEPEVIVFSYRADRFPALSRPVYRVSPGESEELRAVWREAEKAFFLDGNNVSGIREGMTAQASAVVKRLELFLLGALSAGNAVQPQEGGGRSAENYMRILSVMEERLGEALSAGKLARLCNMSVPSLEKTVFRYSGCGAIAYYNALRMKRAAELLSSGASVKEAALSLGFSDQNYFSASFKKWSGKPPSAFRKQS